MSGKSLSELSSKVKIIEQKLNAIIETLHSADEIRKNNASIIDNNFEVLYQKIESLHLDTNKSFKEVKFELVKIQKITDYDELYRNMKIVGDV